MCPSSWVALTRHVHTQCQLHLWGRGSVVQAGCDYVTDKQSLFAPIKRTSITGGRRWLQAYEPFWKVLIKKQASSHLPGPIPAAGLVCDTTADNGGASWRLLPAGPNSLDWEQKWRYAFVICCVASKDGINAHFHKYYAYITFWSKHFISHHISYITVRTELSLWPSVVFAADEWTNLMHGHS